MGDVTLSAAADTDTGAISALAGKIWMQHYPSIIGMDQVRYMLRLMYSHEALAEQMQKKGHRFFFVNVDGAREGFLSVHTDSDGSWWFNKFYVNQDIAAKGIGSKAFDLLVEMLKPDTLHLTVNRQNYKSINFYFKKGFRIERVADFDIGDGYVMNDFVMVWKRK
jgi:diamine N-acetyltransferase